MPRSAVGTADSCWWTRPRMRTRSRPSTLREPLAPPAIQGMLSPGMPRKEFGPPRNGLFTPYIVEKRRIGVFAGAYAVACPPITAMSAAAPRHAKTQRSRLIVVSWDRPPIYLSRSDAGNAPTFPARWRPRAAWPSNRHQLEVRRPRAAWPSTRPALALAKEPDC